MLRVRRQTVSVLPPAMVGNWIVALPAPLGLRPWRITWRLLAALVDRLMEPTVVPGVPMVREPLVTVVAPFRLTAPVPVPNVPTPLWLKLPLVWI